MSPNSPREPSPFAARTRAPFPAPAANVPPSANGAPAPKPKKSAAPLWIGALVVLAALSGGAFLLTGKKSSDSSATAADSPSPTPSPRASATAPARDARADFESLAARAAALDLSPSDRAALAAATLRAGSGAHAEAVAALGPVVSRAADASYAADSVFLREIDLGEHATPSAQKLRLALGAADQAAASAIWAEAVARREEARAILPAARAEIAAQLAGMARAALARSDADLATYFYERALRLAPDDAAARAHLFAHKFKPGQTLRGAAGIEFAYAPPGEFVRGSRSGEPGRGPDEEQARVRLDAGLFVGVTEITQRQWDAVLGPGSAARTLRAARADASTIGPDLPMHSVSWAEATEFCEKLSALDGARHRLPTEAEWEYACRAGTTSAFNTGREGLSSREANIDDGSADARLGPAPSGTLGEANAWGLRDLHGNVWEWCADWSAPYPAGDQTDPRGPADSAVGRVELAMRVVRGGGWNAPAADARSANRWEYAPDVATAYIGLRVVREPDLVAP